MRFLILLPILAVVACGKATPPELSSDAALRFTEANELLATMTAKEARGTLGTVSKTTARALVDAEALMIDECRKHPDAKVGERTLRQVLEDASGYSFGVGEKLAAVAAADCR